MTLGFVPSFQSEGDVERAEGIDASDPAPPSEPDPSERPARNGPDAPVAAPVPPAEGVLTIDSPIRLEVHDGPSQIGTSEDGEIRLRPGQYMVRLVNATYGFEQDAVIDIRSGEVSTLAATLPDGSVIVNVESGAEVFVDGQPAGTSPLGPIPMRIGPHEVLVSHPELGERRQSVDVRTGSPIELDMALVDGNPAPETGGKPAANSTSEPEL
jgi:hypothetical protein